MQQAAAVLGQAAFDKVLDLLMRDPSIFESDRGHENGAANSCHHSKDDD